MKTAIVSGYFNPLHVGHLEYIAAAYDLAERVVVIVNNDEQVRLKGSVPFMDEEDRVFIIDSLKMVSKTFLSIDNSPGVADSIRELYKVLPGTLIYCTGADHTKENTPAETEVCKELGLEIIYGVGGDKVRSSGLIIKKALDSDMW